ncbi:MAG: PIG-L family deacetylase [Flavisolibacter sp.]|nr:PIG-L family deacetylase [Flavisolibacter sp.]
MKRISVLFSLFSFYFFANGQVPVTKTSADIYQDLRRLNVLGSVLYIAAHPDDENTRLLTYLAKDKLYRTGYLSLTRGDGGQNLIGDEQGVELGLIRTQELLAARRIDGAEQFFTRAFDFGFSKGPEETFTKWDREKILSDVVWVIRKFQPDVIITRFPTTGEGGHGQHTASAILANEAFTAAADPKRFPEQLRWVQPWQAKRILLNGFNFGGNNTQRSDQFRFDVGGYNPLLGKSYGEIAAESRSQHKSQGFGVSRSRGEAWEYFSTTGGAAPRNDLFDDVPVTWQRVNGGEAIAASIQNIIASFDFTQPQKSVPQLVQLYKSLKALPQGYWQALKLKEVQNLLEHVSGLFMEAYTAQPFGVQTDSIRVNFSLNNRMGSSIVLNKIILEKFDTTVNNPLAQNKNLALGKSLFIPADKPFTQPYWLQSKMEEGYYNVLQQQAIGEPDIQPAMIASFHVTIEGENFVYEKPVRYKFNDPVKGELYQPFVILPKVEVGFTTESYLSVNNEPVPVQGWLKTNRNDSARYQLTYIHSANWTNDKKDANLGTNGKSDYDYINTLKPFQKGVNRKEDIGLKATDKNGQVYEHNRRTISYDHIPAITYFPKATAHLVSVDVKTAGKKIGYIPGAGDKVPAALEAMGYEVTILTDKELSRKKIKDYDAIITGVRTYNTNEWMNNYYSKLMKYIEEGGNLIVQYNTSTQIGPVKAKIGPYDFTITRNRVTDETAPVSFLKPQHPVLNYPNKITADDFKGWIQERSIYHAGNWNKAFETIFAMNDVGEQPDSGSLIIARYGRGYFTYTGLVFFRELPAGVPGAYRLMANLIALNQKKEF